MVAKAEYLAKGDTPRFIVTNPTRQEYAAQLLCEKVYCARGEKENRILSHQIVANLQRAYPQLC